MHTTISKNRKMKRATLLIKRMRCIRNLPGNKKKSYKPLYEKLKINNHSLAKALSKEKQDNKALFSQNVALIAENQDLEVACNKRDNIISNVMQNAKEILKMLVQTTGYVTNTITLCQEFTSANKENVQTPCNMVERRDSSMKRLSGKSPARGVVKPMVSGHTITKPTINLSRVNIHRLSDRINLSTIAETSTRSDRSENTDEDPSPIAAPIRQVRYENGRACRLPERLPITSPRSSEEDERRLSRKSNRHSGKVSGKHSRSKSNRLSDSGDSEHSVRRKDSLGSPCVKLNDVSKLLQNSQRVNVQMLNEQRASTTHDNSLQTNTIRDVSATSRVSETEMSFDCSLGNYSKLEQPSLIKKASTTPERHSSKTSNNVKKNKKSSKRRENISNGDDPLEGPSWMYNDHSYQSPSPRKETEESPVNDDTQSPLKSLDHTLNGSVNNLEQNETLQTPVEAFKNPNVNESLNTQTPPFGSSQENEFHNPELAVKLNFITRRRGCSEVESDDDTDDFTLMYKPPPSRNQPFGLEDLRLPTLEKPVLAASHNFNREHEPEITETIKRITQNFLPSAVSNNSLVENGLDSSTMKLPLYLSTIEQTAKLEATPAKRKTDKHQQPKPEENSSSDANTPPQVVKKKNKRKKKSTDDKDPSTAKVVLQKLNDNHVKKKSQHSNKELQKQNSQTQSWNKSPISAVSLDSTDSDTSTASNKQTSNRPRRRKAPLNLQEPSLSKKLRREH